MLWQIDYADRSNAPTPEAHRHPTALQPGLVRAVGMMHWEEHCIECSIPECYRTCPLYERRADGGCARLAYGIVPNPAYHGLLPYGADLQFRRWGKLEARLRPGSVPTATARIADLANRGAIAAINPIAEAFTRWSPDRRLKRTYSHRSNLALNAVADRLRDSTRFDEFVIEAWNPQTESFRLVMEVVQGGVVYRESFTMAPGRNLHRIPVAELNADLTRGGDKILFYPENDAEVRLIFTWLDFVLYQQPPERLEMGQDGVLRPRTSSDGFSPSTGPSCTPRTVVETSPTPASRSSSPPPATRSSKPTAQPTSGNPRRFRAVSASDVRYPASTPESADASTSASPAPAAKVKCVVFDLDNTLWRGTLVDDGPYALELRDEAVDLIHGLDERGILISCASKNDHEAAWAKIEAFGLADYFLYPAIHWGPKSGSLQAIADELNINIDTFAFIDDSPFERAEVGETLPQVRVYRHDEVNDLLTLPEFDVPITETSKLRRQSYLAEAQRKRIARDYHDNPLDFLRRCEMKIEIFVPEDPAHVKRALELLQRSNQLNLSTHRYSDDEFERLRQRDDMLILATRARDRFGDYGIINVATVQLGERADLVDFVQSCRVAQKKLENAWFNWLIEHLKPKGYDRLHARFVPTKRNGVLMEVFDEVGFVETNRDGADKLLELPFARPPHFDVVRVEASL